MSQREHSTDIVTLGCRLNTLESEVMRDEFNEKRRAVPLLHRNGHTYKISTHNEKMRRVDINKLPKFGPYKLVAEMPFPDEIE